MMEYLYLARWDQTFGFLASGSPPMYVRLGALNAFFIAIYAIRRAIGADTMTAGKTLFAQLTVLGANLLLLYEPQVELYLRTVMSRS